MQVSVKVGRTKGYGKSRVSDRSIRGRKASRGCIADRKVQAFGTSTSSPVSRVLCYCAEMRRTGTAGRKSHLHFELVPLDEVMKRVASNASEASEDAAHEPGAEASTGDRPLPVQCPRCKHDGNRLLVRSMTVITLACNSCRHAWATTLDALEPAIQEQVQTALLETSIH